LIAGFTYKIAPSEIELRSERQLSLPWAVAIIYFDLAFYNNNKIKKKKKKKNKKKKKERTKKRKKEKRSRL
jgi:hypothetical protein